MSISISTEKVHDQLERQMRTNGLLEPNEALSLYRVAKDTGLSWKTVSDLYKGKANNIMSDTLAAVCRFYGCEPADIIAYVEDDTLGNIIDNPNHVSEFAVG